MHARHESRIEDFAFEYLKSYYVQRHNATEVQVFMGEASKNGAVADGLFTYSKSAEPLFVASLLLEHSDKLASILRNYKKKAYKTACNTTTFLAAAAAAVSSFWLTDNLLIVSIATLLVAPLIYLVCRVSHKAIQKRRVAHVLSAFRRLPSNEKWIGISISSQTLKRNALAQYMLKACEERGIGVITVGKRAKVVLVKEPKNYTRRTGDFLSFYKSEISMRKEILGDNVMRVA